MTDDLVQRLRVGTYDWLCARELHREAADRIEAMEQLTRQQANDERLWFVAETLTEDTLQKALRLLHAAIEGTDFFGRALERKETK